MLGEKLLILRGEVTAHLPMLRFNPISTLSEEIDYV
jgi:hypothetical protein